MTTASAPAPPEAATNEELIRWAFDVLNTHDVSPVRPMWTSTTVERFPTETCVGADAIAAYFEAAFAALPDFHIEIQALAASGDDVMVRWHLTGTHSGAAWQGIAPTGRRVELDGIDHFVIRDGNVVVELRRLRPDAVRPGGRTDAARRIVCRAGDEGGVRRQDTADEAPRTLSAQAPRTPRAAPPVTQRS